MTNKQRQGQCQCAHIRYELRDEPLTFYICHCLHCQKQSSSAFGMSLWVRPGDFKIVSGELSYWTTQGDSGVQKICGFCGICGSRIYHGTEDESAPISIKAGTLNDISSLRPIAHIWTSRAQPWVLIDRDEYLCFDEQPADDESLLDLWKESHKT